MADRLDISQRKKDHLALCSGPNVGFRDKSTLFEDVEFVHCALPELHLDEIDTRVELVGKQISAPIVVAAMTGGTDRASAINKDLARVVQDLGLGFGLGSQRAMFERPETTWTFEVRDVAPDILLFGNLGLVQAREMSTTQIRELCDRVGVDALCVHLNAAMEVVQPGGDRDFRGGLEVLRRLTGELGIPVIAKETGCGLSRVAAEQIASAGVRTVDTSGAGGTSWVAVEAHRATDLDDKAIANELWDWGIPTAASVLQLQGLGLDIIATGGVRSGSDVAKAVGLGAKAGGIAAAVLKAHKAGGAEGARTFLRQAIKTVRAIMLLTGCSSVDQLQRVQTVLGPKLSSWTPKPAQP